MIKLFIVCVLFFSTVCFADEGKPHLMLHFDINKTLITFDAVQDETIDNIFEEAPHLSEEEMREICEKVEAWPVCKSFFSLITFLREEEYSFTVFLRTFGHDLSFTSDRINAVLDEPFFEKSGTFKQGMFHVDNQSFSDPKSIYDYLATSSHMLIRDDYYWWKSHKKDPFYGKPLYIDPISSEIQFFFDDHSDIVAQIDARTGEEIVDLPENAHVIKVDTFQAILDDAYFLKHVKQAILSTETSQDS